MRLDFSPLAPRAVVLVLVISLTLTGCGTSSKHNTPPSDELDRVGVVSSSCDPNYTNCVPLVEYDLDCADIGRSVEVVGVDVHRFDADGDGYGCESYG